MRIQYWIRIEGVFEGQFFDKVKCPKCKRGFRRGSKIVQIICIRTGLSNKLGEMVPATIYHSRCRRN